MSTFGIIFCAYNTADLLSASLQPWVDARRNGVAGHSFKICAVCVPFTGFPQDGPPDNTQALLEARLAAGEIDRLITSDMPMAETEARGQALQWLVGAGATDLWQADSDEMPTQREIARIVSFWTARMHLTWARLSYRNLVFTPDQWMVEPFQPARIHRVTPPGHAGYRAHSFYQDNNVAYGGLITRDLVPDEHFASVVVPPVIAFIKHASWLNSPRSRAKIEYQLTGRQWPTCTFAWDDAQGGLIWRDPANAPETARDP